MKKRVLIVDDIPENLRVLLEILKDEYQVLAANGGAKAIEMAKKEPYPDIILLDVMMPEVSGFDVCRELKSDEKTKNIPVLFVTAATDSQSEKEGLSLGAIDYITKPVVPELVSIRVKNHLELKSYRDELEKRVEEETAKRMEQQELLIKQSRLSAMGEMMSVITHQWQQPVNIISMANEMTYFEIEEQQESVHNAKEILEHCNTIFSNVQFMTKTMRDFKNYFKSGATKESLNIKHEIETIIDMLRPQMKIYSIIIHTDIDETLQVEARGSEFKQIILNLISNAKDAIKAKYKEEGGDIYIRAKKDGGGKTIIEVGDNGGGVPDNVIDSIFDNYFSTKGDEGTGIGLALCKMIVEDNLGGRISVSNSDIGAVFRVEV